MGSVSETEIGDLSFEVELSASWEQVRAGCVTVIIRHVLESSKPILVRSHGYHISAMELFP